MIKLRVIIWFWILICALIFIITSCDNNKNSQDNTSVFVVSSDTASVVKHDQLIMLDLPELSSDRVDYFIIIRFAVRAETPISKGD